MHIHIQCETHTLTHTPKSCPDCFYVYGPFYDWGTSDLQHLWASVDFPGGNSKKQTDSPDFGDTEGAVEALTL